MAPYLTQYQSANISDEQSVQNFVVRKKEFERVMSDIRMTDGETSFQHYVFVGRRGSGNLLFYAEYKQKQQSINS